MSKKYVVINTDGTNAFYDDAIHSTMPNGALEISDADYKTFFSDNGKYIFVNNNGTPKLNIQTLTLEQAKTAKELQIKSLLLATDHEAIKYAEGQLTTTQYTSMKLAREAWRASIRSIEACTTVSAVNAVNYSTNIPTI